MAIVEEIYKFRNGHWQFVQKYIMANTKYAKATGGTPIISWIPNQIKAVLEFIKIIIENISQIGEIKNDLAKQIFNSSNLSELVNNIYNLFSNDIEIIDIQIFIPEWFDKFKETSKKLIYHPNKQNVDTTPFKITPELIKFILKTKESIYDIQDISNKVTNIDPNLTKKSNFILVSYNEENEIIALIIIGQKLSEKKYTKEDSQLLKTLSNQITPAMQKIKQIRLNGEIEIAQKIQSEIIPQNHVIPNCTTSADLEVSPSTHEPLTTLTMT